MLIFMDKETGIIMNPDIKLVEFFENENSFMWGLSFFIEDIEVAEYIENKYKNPDDVAEHAVFIGFL